MALAAIWFYVRSPWWRRQFDPIAQPVAFDHRHHVQDDGIECRYCHAAVEYAATAGIPATEVCMGGVTTKFRNHSLQLYSVRHSYFSGEPIVWSRVHDVPDYVYLKIHSIHINHGVGCTACHGRVDEMARVYQEMTLTMGWCVHCHRAPESKLRPVQAVTDMRYRRSEHPGDVIPACSCMTHLHRVSPLMNDPQADTDDDRIGYWKSLSEEVHAPQTDSVRRRDILKYLASSMALVGLYGCAPKRAEKIGPLCDIAQGLTPTVSEYYATSMELDGFATGLWYAWTTGDPPRSTATPLTPPAWGCWRAGAGVGPRPL